MHQKRSNTNPKSVPLQADWHNRFSVCRISSHVAFFQMCTRTWVWIWPISGVIKSPMPGHMGLSHPGLTAVCTHMCHTYCAQPGYCLHPTSTCEYNQPPSTYTPSYGLRVDTACLKYDITSQRSVVFTVMNRVNHMNLTLKFIWFGFLLTRFISHAWDRIHTALTSPTYKVGI